jgi:hypothetical protein
MEYVPECRADQSDSGQVLQRSGPGAQSTKGRRRWSMGMGLSRAGVRLRPSFSSRPLKAVYASASVAWPITNRKAAHCGSWLEMMGADNDETCSMKYRYLSEAARDAVWRRRFLLAQSPRNRVNVSDNGS